MSSIIKLGADHLRAFSNNHSVKLKSGHAHELVAAFFGYKSKAAMQADILCSVENLGQAPILVLMPSAFIDQRRKLLEDLPLDLPDTYSLGEELYVGLIFKKRFTGRSFGVWRHLVEVLATEYLMNNRSSILSTKFRFREKALYLFNKPLYEFNPKVETSDQGTKLTVTNRYYSSSGIHFQPIDVLVTIELKRVAGYVGFGEPKISVLDITDHSVSKSVLI
jgi:hypothetical protein